MVSRADGGPLMAGAEDIIRTAGTEVCRPWPRHILSHPGWNALAQASALESWVLLAHWADRALAYAVFLNPWTLTIVPVSTWIEAGHYPALSPMLPPAAWYERMIQDLWGHQADGAIDQRPWLDHGNWPVLQPMAARPAATKPFEPRASAEPDQDDDMVLPRGPIWGRLDEPAHLRLTLLGPAIRDAEALLGFAHKGTLSLMCGKSPRIAARFAARLSADATVAHSVAFARAAEAALDVSVPPRAVGLRIIMMEIERVAAHLDNLAEVGRLAGSRTVHTRCGYLRETMLRACDAAFGHRLMMDCVIPGGVASDIADGGERIVSRALSDVALDMQTVLWLHQGPVLLSRLDGLGRTDGALAAAFGAGGVVGRASGCQFDVRTALAEDYRDLAPRLALRQAGDAAARQQVRILEIEESLRLISVVIDRLATGPVNVAMPQDSGEGIACAESIRGDVWHWLRIEHGQIVAAFARDPGWALWPLFERALDHTSAFDIDLMRASFALPASGMDL